MQPGTAKGEQRYLCPATGNGGCAGTTVKMGLVEPRVVELVLEHLDSPEFAAALDRARRAADRADRSFSAAVDQLNRDRAALAALDDAYADGLLDAPRYKRQVERLTARVSEGEAKVTSMVTTERPRTCMAKRWQAYTGCPSSRTVHAPHSPRSQARLAPVRSRWSRSTSRSVVR